MLGTPLGRILLDRPAWTYLLGPFFKASTPDQAAPLSATYREAGAVGALSVVDSGNSLSISGGVQVWSGGRVSNIDPAVIAPPLSRIAGRALLVRHTNNASVASSYLAPGWGGGAANSTVARFGVLNATTAIFDGAALNLPALSGWGVGVAFDLAVVLRGTGAFFLVKGGGYANWTLWWVGVANSSSPLYPTVNLPNLGVATTLVNLRVVDLGGAWASDTGIAVAYAATTANGDLALMTANALVYHTVTAATGVTQELSVRRTDDSNRWVVRMDQVGSTVKLIEIVAGVETERSSAAQTWVNGTQYRVGVILDGNTINTFVANVAKNSYASASFNNTATGVKVSHAGGPLESWPRTVSLPQGV